MQWPLLSRLDERLNDVWLRTQAVQGTPDPDILIIDIDDASLAAMATEVGRWPWPRSLYAYFLEGLAKYDYQAMAFDLMLSEPDLYRPDDDAFFVETFSQYSNLFLSAAWRNNAPQSEAISLSRLPHELFLHTGPANAQAVLDLPAVVPEEQWQMGLINFFADSDGIGRYFDSRYEFSGWVLPTLPALLAHDAGIAYAQMPTRFRLNFQGTELVPYQSIGFHQALALVNQPYQPELAAFFRYKILLLGTTATGLHDLRHTPISERQPGVVVLATALDNLMNQNYYQSLPQHLSQLGVLLMSALLLWLMARSSSYQQFLQQSLLVVCLSLVLLLLAAYLASRQLWLLPVAGPLMVLMLLFVLSNFYRGLREFLLRRHTTQMFSRFMDPKVVANLVESQDWQAQVKPRNCRITVLFSDIRGFTTLSESRSPEQIMGLLNDYFAIQVDCIFAHGGTLDKFIGDAIMAFWGAPLEDSAQADRAIACARQMLVNLQQFRAGLPEDLRELDIGIGIHTGPAVVGMLGSQKRYDYTAIGDTINLASRIEGLTKEQGRLLVSEHTLKACLAPPVAIPAGSFQVKGRAAQVTLYRLVDSQQEIK